jgi:hypothetical protein
LHEIFALDNINLMLEKPFGTFEVIVVWAGDKLRIQNLLSTLNNPHHMQFKCLPTYHENLMHLRQIWEELGRSTNTLNVGKKNENM